MTSSAFLPKPRQDLTKVLVTAISEWFLISVLFIVAIFSYIVTKFAYYCGLQTPCLLCSRLDHVLGKEKLGYYWELFCSHHTSEISSLVLCHAHNKLVDVHGMCESCLFSFATINRSNAETYRLLVGKMGDYPNSNFDHDPLLVGHSSSFSDKRYCSCCNKPWISRGHSEKLIQTNFFGSEAEFDALLTGGIEHNQKELKKEQDKSSISVRATQVRDSGLHPLSHVGYTELKVNSDTESEIHFSDNDDDDASAFVHEECGPKEDIPSQPVVPFSITPPLIDSASVPKPSAVSPVQVAPMRSHASTSAASTGSINHGLEELNWHQVESKAHFPTLNDPILDNASPSSNTREAPLDLPKERRTHEIQTTATESGEFYEGGDRPATTSETVVETNPAISNTDQQVPSVLDLGDAYKLVVVSKGRQLSGVLAEQWVGKDTSKVTEDLKVLLSQLSLNRGIEQSTNEMSPKVSANSGDSKFSDSSNSLGMQLLHKRISLERNESGLSMDGSVVSEIEGESAVDRLKRQVEHDKKIISSLYKELEEERNASAVASDQAMAMITRLQEEKAALHMEALQNLRMMEEQAEYDNEALQKTDDLLVEKEKEIQDLEAELEFFRTKYPHISLLENQVETTCDVQTRDIMVDHSESSSTEHSASVHKHLDNGRPRTYIEVGGTPTLFSAENGDSLKTSVLDSEVHSRDTLRKD